MTLTKTSPFETLLSTIESLDTNTITEERQQILQPLTEYIQQKVLEKEEISLNFICTHNSRRSHLSQIWAQAMAAFYTVPSVFCYSGGTEATALFPMVVQTLEKSGFVIDRLSEGVNPVYSIKFSENVHPIIGFSKAYDNAFNPTTQFAALMTCSQADEGCPFIAGTDKRIPLTFEDPKVFDNTPQQEEKYLERSLQIATELKYVFAQV